MPQQVRSDPNRQRHSKRSPQDRRLALWLLPLIAEPDAHRWSVQPNIDGLTTEQMNIKKRLEVDNTPGAIKHVYIISAFSGDVIVYSTAVGKVTSSGKRLSPYSVLTANGSSGNQHSHGYTPKGTPVNIGGQQHLTNEVLQDDGTYGSSIPYLFWTDTKGVFHKHYPTGGQIIHVTDQPMVIPKVIINMETMALEPKKPLPAPAPKPDPKPEESVPAAAPATDSAG